MKKPKLHKDTVIQGYTDYRHDGEVMYRHCWKRTGTKLLKEVEYNGVKIEFRHAKDNYLLICSQKVVLQRIYNPKVTEKELSELTDRVPVVIDEYKQQIDQTIEEAYFNFFNEGKL